MMSRSNVALEFSVKEGPDASGRPRNQFQWFIYVAGCGGSILAGLHYKSMLCNYRF